MDDYSLPVDDHGFRKTGGLIIDFDLPAAIVQNVEGELELVGEFHDLVATHLVHAHCYDLEAGWAQFLV